MAQSTLRVVLGVGIAQRPVHALAGRLWHADHHAAHRLARGENALERPFVPAHRLAVLSKHLPAVRRRFGQGTVRTPFAPTQEAPGGGVDAGQGVIGPKHHHARAEVVDQGA
ncbi:hypothetical protein FQZ97_929250 [compost metagenome]